MRDRLKLTQEKKADVVDRVVLVGLPAFLTWYMLGVTPYWFGAVSIGGEIIGTSQTLLTARLTAVAVGGGLGAPLALVVVAWADGWGLVESGGGSTVISGEEATSSETRD